MRRQISKCISDISKVILPYMVYITVLMAIFWSVTIIRLFRPYVELEEADKWNRYPVVMFGEEGSHTSSAVKHMNAWLYVYNLLCCSEYQTIWFIGSWRLFLLHPVSTTILVVRPANLFFIVDILQLPVVRRNLMHRWVRLQHWEQRLFPAELETRTAVQLHCVQFKNLPALSTRKSLPARGPIERSFLFVKLEVDNQLQ